MRHASLLCNVDPRVRNGLGWLFQPLHYKLSQISGNHIVAGRRGVLLTLTTLPRTTTGLSGTSTLCLWYSLWKAFGLFLNKRAYKTFQANKK